MTTKLTQDRFEKLSPPGKTAVYFSHPDNLRAGRGNSQGPSVAAQAAFINNWQTAFADFHERLPTR